jgi:hypothetical protein
MGSAYEDAMRAGGLAGRKKGHAVGNDAVPPSRYEATIKKYLEKCGPQASATEIAEAIRADNVQVGHWLNPTLKLLDPMRFDHLEINVDKLPHGYPFNVVVDKNGKQSVVRS